MRRRPTTWLRVLLALWVIVAVCFPVLGEHRANYADLVAAVETHSVGSVTVEGNMMPGSSGTWTATVHWRQGPARRYTDVRQEVNPSQEGSRNSDSSADATIRRSVVEDLHAHWPQLHITQRAQATHSSVTALGWRGPWPLSILTFAVWALTVGAFLGARDEPPWATRWGWGWWFLSPLSVPALVLWLVAMIRAKAIGRPAQVRGRLTGGWSFLLALLFSGSLASAIQLG